MCIDEAGACVSLRLHVAQNIPASYVSSTLIRQEVNLVNIYFLLSSWSRFSTLEINYLNHPAHLPKTRIIHLGITGVLHSPHIVIKPYLLPPSIISKTRP